MVTITKAMERCPRTPRIVAEVGRARRAIDQGAIVVSDDWRRVPVMAASHHRGQAASGSTKAERG